MAHMLQDLPVPDAKEPHLQAKRSYHSNQVGLCVPTHRNNLPVGQKTAVSSFGVFFASKGEA